MLNYIMVRMRDDMATILKEYITSQKETDKESKARRDAQKVRYVVSFPTQVCRGRYLLLTDSSLLIAIFNRFQVDLLIIVKQTYLNSFL